MRQNLFDAAFLFGAFAGSTVVLALGIVGSAWGACWWLAIWRREI